MTDDQSKICVDMHTKSAISNGNGRFLLSELIFNVEINKPFQPDTVSIHIHITSVYVYKMVLIVIKCIDKHLFYTVYACKKQHIS